MLGVPSDLLTARFGKQSAYKPDDASIGILMATICAETPTWRKAGGNLDLCNACGVRISAKARNRQHPPLPARPTANAAQKQALQPALSLPVNNSEAAVRQPCMLPKAASMPTATQKHDSRLIFEQFLGQPQALPSALPVHLSTYWCIVHTALS